MREATDGRATSWNGSTKPPGGAPTDRARGPSDTRSPRSPPPLGTAASPRWSARRTRPSEARPRIRARSTPVESRARARVGSPRRGGGPAEASCAGARRRAGAVPKPGDSAPKTRANAQPAFAPVALWNEPPTSAKPTPSSARSVGFERARFSHPPPLRGSPEGAAKASRRSLRSKHSLSRRLLTESSPRERIGSGQAHDWRARRSSPRHRPISTPRRRAPRLPDSESPCG